MKERTIRDVERDIQRCRHDMNAALRMRQPFAASRRRARLEVLEQELKQMKMEGER